MIKKIYLIPGQGENCNLVRYKNLEKALSNKGYTVNNINPNWYKPLTTQVFPVEKTSIVVGFSLGAVLAYLVAKKYPCKKVVFASISPIHTFSEQSFVKDLEPYMSKNTATEIFKDLSKIKIDLANFSTPYVTLKGELEKDVDGQIEVPRTGHHITKTYIKYIVDLL